MRRALYGSIVAGCVVACAALFAACGGDDTSGTQAPPIDASIDTTMPAVDSAVDAPLTPPYTLTGDAVQGWQYVQQRMCPSCHEPADPSEGFMSGQDTPQPGTTAYGSNLTPDPDTGLDAWSAAIIARALRQGIDDQGQPICPSMPRYADMQDDEVIAIAAFMQSLPAVHHDIPASVCAIDAGVDAGSDAGADAGVDAGIDAGVDAGIDAGIDAGVDAGIDAGVDAGVDASVDASADGADGG